MSKSKRVSELFPDRVKFKKGQQLFDPLTGDVIAIFAGYKDGHETWRDSDGVEEKTFEGFSAAGFSSWSQSIGDFAAQVTERVK